MTCAGWDNDAGAHPGSPLLLGRPPGWSGSAAAVARTGASPAPECWIFVHQVAHPGPGSILLRLKVGLGAARPAPFRDAREMARCRRAGTLGRRRQLGGWADRWAARAARGVARRLPRCRGLESHHASTDR